MTRTFNLRRRGLTVHEIADITGQSPDNVVAVLADPSLDSGGGGSSALQFKGELAAPSPDPLPNGSVVRYNNTTYVVTGGDMPGGVTPGEDPNQLTWRGFPTAMIDQTPVVDGATALLLINENSPVAAAYPGRAESKLILAGVKCVQAGPVRLNLGLVSSVIGFLSGDTELAIYRYEDQDTPIVTVDNGFSGINAGIDGFQFDVGLYVLVGTHKRLDVDISGEYYFDWQPPGNSGSTPMRTAYFGPDEADYVDATWGVISSA